MTVTTPRKIRLPAVAILMVVFAGGSGVAYVVHGYQIRRNARVFIEQADRARDAKEPIKELRFVESYLGLVPNDAEVRARFALLLDSLVQSRRDKERVFYALDAALRFDPQRVDLRRRAIQISLEVDRTSDALFHLQELMKQEGETAENLETMGDIERQRGNYAKAEQSYAQAYAKDPKRVQAYIRRAVILRTRLKRQEDADRCIEEMVRANPGEPEAEIARIRYARETRGAGLPKDEYLGILSELIQKHGHKVPELYLLAAQLEHEDGKVEAARNLLMQGQQRHPEEVSFPRELARLDLQEGRRQEALAILRGLIDRLPPTSNDYWVTIELLLEAGEMEQVEKLISRVRRGDESSSLADFFEGRAAMVREDWVEAMRRFERVRQDRQLPQEMLQYANLYLGRIHQELNNPDQHLEAAEASLQYDPLWIPGLISRAEALANLGRLDESLSLFETLMGRWPQARLAAAQLWAARNRRLPEDQRNWERPLALLREAPESVRNSPPALVLQARLLVLMNQRAAAEKLLEDAVAKRPKETTLWLGLADIVDDGGQGKSVDAILDRADQAAGDEIDLRLARAQLAARRGDAAKSRELLESAERAAVQKGETERGPWLRQLGRFLLGRGDLEGADRVFSQLTKGDNRNLKDWGTLFEIRLGRNLRDQLEPIVKRLEELEGPEGTMWRYGRAVQLIDTEKPENLAKAREHLAEIRRRRPGWGRSYFLDGQLAEVEGDGETAVQMYQAAIERGESGVEVVRRLVSLLYRQRRYNEAREVLSRFRDLLRVSPDLNRLATLTLFQTTQDRDNILEQARKTLAEDSKDFRDHLLRGQILWSARHRDEAEQAFRRAVELAPQEPECTIALVTLLQETNPPKALEEIEAAAKRLPESVAPLVLASCYEVVGQPAKAEAQYAKAASLRPEDPTVLRAQANFYLRRGQLSRAEPIFRRLISLTSTRSPALAGWARRTLALALAATGDYERFREALRLIDENATSQRPSADDQRIRALILARQPKERREAIRNLESSFARVPPSPEEEYFLATLLIANREWPKARERLIRLLANSENPNPAFLVYFLEQLIQNDELSQADLWLSRLEALEPNSLRTVAIKARLAVARKQHDEALRLLLTLAPTLKNDPAQLQALARVMESLGFKREAELYYRQVAERKDENPRLVLPLIGFLGRCQRVGEALPLLAQIRNKIPDPAFAEVAVGVLRDGQPNPEQIRTVANWINELKTKYPGQPIFDLALANILDLRGQPSEAIQAYRDLLQRDPGNVLAYNNMAVLLALAERKYDEALQAVNKAIDLAGPLPNLLDSRGIVHISQQQAKAAIADLEEATQMTSDPASLFRLATAYLLGRDRRAAQSAWQKAQAAGFQIHQLHPLERANAQKVIAELDTSPDRS